MHNKFWTCEDHNNCTFHKNNCQSKECYYRKGASCNHKRVYSSVRHASLQCECTQLQSFKNTRKKRQQNWKKSQIDSYGWKCQHSFFNDVWKIR